MDRRTWLLAIAGVIVVVVAAVLFARSLDLNPNGNSSATEASGESDGAAPRHPSDPCASSATYQGLKQLAFQQAVQLRSSDSANLDTLAANSVVRMESPVVKSEDEGLNLTVCTGRFVLELPPGSENAFGGQRRLAADVEYSAQPASDGSGIVYRMTGAEAIVQALAAFDLRGQPYQPPAPPSAPQGDEATADNAPESSPPSPPRATVPAPAPAPPEPPAAPEPPRNYGASPSFDCRNARSPAEEMICSSNRLARKDRQLASLYAAALADADPGTRSALRRTAQRFIAYRDRCGSEDCVADAYNGRMDEIRDIMATAE